MMQSLPIPSWDSLHPLVIHFPIVLLLIAPLFVFLGAVAQASRKRTFLISAWILMILGTASLYLAIYSGRAAYHLVQRTTEINAVLERHRALATETAITFTVVTALFTLMLLITRFHFEIADLIAVVPFAFVLFYGIGLVFLIITSHNGARLIYEFRINAVVGR